MQEATDCVRAALVAALGPKPGAWFRARSAQSASFNFTNKLICTVWSKRFLRTRAAVVQQCCPVYDLRIATHKNRTNACARLARANHGSIRVIASLTRFRPGLLCPCLGFVGRLACTE